MKKKCLLLFCLLLFSITSIAQSGKGAGAAAPAASTGANAPAAQVQPGYHYFISKNRIKIDWQHLKIKIVPKHPLWYLTTSHLKLPGKHCQVPKNIATVFFTYNKAEKRYKCDVTDTFIINSKKITTNFSKPFPTDGKNPKKDTSAFIENSNALPIYTITTRSKIPKYADTCSSYIRYLAKQVNGEWVFRGPDTLITVTTIDTEFRYFPKLRGVGIVQDSGKLQLLLNGERKSVESSVAKLITQRYNLKKQMDSINSKRSSDTVEEIYYSQLSSLANRSAELTMQIDAFYGQIHTFSLIEVDSNKYDSCRFCGHGHRNSPDTMQNGVFVYARRLVSISPIDSIHDSVNNFFLFIKKRYKVRDPIYVYKIPFARWEAGAVNIPFQFTPGHNDVALNSITTSFVNVNAFIGRAIGSTKFFYDPTKTHTGFTGMLSAFAGFGQLPALVFVPQTNNYAYNLYPQAKSLAGTAQLGFSYGFAGSMTIDIVNIGVFAGNTLAMGSREIVNGWYDENKWWVGFGIGFNLGIFNNALTTAWE